MRTLFGLTCLWMLAAPALGAAPAPAPVRPGEEVLASAAPQGQHGGRLVVALRAEPTTLNPVFSADVPSRDVIGRIMAGLIHINRASQLTEPALAKSWRVSKDGREYELQLRRGLRFSDGHSCDADDVTFSFQVLLDEKVRSPHRDLLVMGGKPIVVQRIDAHTVRVTLPQPYAAAERLFTGIAILPRHLLEPTYKQGKLAETWTLATPPSAIAGLGPYRLKEYVPGQRVVLERNPYYWKVDRAERRLPYIDEIAFEFVGTEDAQVLRFRNGENDVLQRISPDAFAALGREQQARGYQLRDLGPALEYTFLLFNLNDLSSRTLPQVAARQAWFRDLRFRRAVSLALDRAGMVRLVYQGRATPIWTNVTPGNRQWVNRSIPTPAQSIDRARSELRAAGFSWRPDGALIDPSGRPVEFSIVSSSTNTQRLKMATIVQDDLKQIGMKVNVVPLEFRALVDRVYQTYDYEAAILTLGGGDADPNSEMNVWLSRGTSHLWHLGQKAPQTPWERELDQLMDRQLAMLDRAERKRLYDRVQEIVATNLPLVFLASANVLVAARSDLGNFNPGILDHQTLWNVDEQYLKSARRSSR
jgi:peptide/nickel transport system substrate-binding protein